jgi:hypothetical protein
MTGKITPYDAVIKSEFSTAVQSYCDGTYASVDEALAEFETSVAGLLVDLNWE